MTSSTPVKSLFQIFFINLAFVIWLTSCAAIRTGGQETSCGSLSPHPVKIYVAPFNLETAKWLVGRRDENLREFKLDFQAKFNEYLVERLQKIAPAETRWVDDLPDEGWLVAGEFKTVFQGSRAERAIIGFGMGETTFQTRVYVYDLSKSKTRYVLTFDTGVPDQDFPWQGSGSGSTAPGSAVSAIAVGAAGAPLSVAAPIVAAHTAVGMGTGLNLDGTRTAREIRNVLMHYAEPERDEHRHEREHVHRHTNRHSRRDHKE
jgi:hypothetical protein